MKLPKANVSASQKAANGGNQKPLPPQKLPGSEHLCPIPSSNINTGAGGVIPPSPSPATQGSPFMTGGDNGSGISNPNVK